MRFGFKQECHLRQVGFHRGKSSDLACYSIVSGGNDVEGEWSLVKEALEQWLRSENFDENGAQKRSLSEIREELMAASGRSSPLSH